MSYDQWKTASPHDDEIDVEQEIDKFIVRLQKGWADPKETIKFLEDLKEWIPEQ